MIVAYLVLFAVAYVVVASWAVSRGGRRRLWQTGFASLALVALVGVLLARAFDVSNAPRLVGYLMALWGPVAIVPTILLSFARPQATWTRHLPLAALGGGIGFILGWITIVFGLGVW